MANRVVMPQIRAPAAHCDDRLWLVVSLPIRCVSHRDGVYECDLDASDAKPSETAFEPVADSFNGRTALVRCFPRTGRTHQIRLHLE
jgi:23S rRNA-/tRNA-specific pseudouridylate synthase